MNLSFGLTTFCSRRIMLVPKNLAKSVDSSNNSFWNLFPMLQYFELEKIINTG